MSYVGPAPANSIIATSDIEDGAVTSAKLGGNIVTPGTLDVNGQEFILDANANTSITADTDDQIDIRIAGADDFQFTANTFTALSGSTVAIASGATIANSGTATGFSVTDHPFVSVYRSAGTANVTGAGTVYTVTWNTELADTGNDFTSNTFTAPSTGFYRVGILLNPYNMTTAATEINVLIVATGQSYSVFYINGVPTDVTQFRVATSKVIKMTASDTFTITIEVSGESGDVVDLDGLKRWSGLDIEFLGNV